MSYEFKRPPGQKEPGRLEQAAWHVSALLRRRSEPMSEVPGIPQWIGNIPGRLFTSNPSGEWLRTGGDRWLQYDVRPGIVSFKYPEERQDGEKGPEFCFMAQFLRDDRRKIPGPFYDTISFDIRT